MNLETCLAPILALAAISTLSMAATIPLLRSGDAQLTSITNPTLYLPSDPAFDTTLDHKQNHIQNTYDDALYDYNRLYPDGLSNLKMEEVKGGIEANIPIKKPFDLHHDKFYSDFPSKNSIKLDELRNPNSLSKKPLKSEDYNKVEYNAENKINLDNAFEDQNKKLNSVLESILDFEEQFENKSITNNVRSNRVRRDTIDDIILKQRRKMISEGIFRLKAIKLEVINRMKTRKDAIARMKGDLSTEWINSELRIINGLAREANRHFNQIQRIAKEDASVIWKEYLKEKEMEDAIRKEELELKNLSKEELIARINEKRRARAEKYGLPFRKFEG